MFFLIFIKIKRLKILYLQCGHFFHVLCFKEWFKKQKNVVYVEPQ